MVENKLQLSATMRHLRSCNRFRVHMRNSLEKDLCFCILFLLILWLPYAAEVGRSSIDPGYRFFKWWAETIPMKPITAITLVLFLAEQYIHFLFAVQNNLKCNLSKSLFDERVIVSFEKTLSGLDVSIMPECLDNAIPTYMRLQYSKINHADMRVRYKEGQIILEIPGSPQVILSILIGGKFAYSYELPRDSRWYKWQLHKTETLLLKIDPLYTQAVDALLSMTK